MKDIIAKKVSMPPATFENARLFLKTLRSLKSNRELEMAWVQSASRCTIAILYCKKIKKRDL